MRDTEVVEPKKDQVSIVGFQEGRLATGKDDSPYHVKGTQIGKSGDQKRIIVVLVVAS